MERVSSTILEKFKQVEDESTSVNLLHKLILSQIETCNVEDTTNNEIRSAGKVRSSSVKSNIRGNDSISSTKQQEHKTNSPKKFKEKNGKVKKFTKDVDLGPPMRAELRKEIERKLGVNIQLVIMKKIFPSDLNKTLNRLSMPINQVKSEGSSFLTEEEKEELRKGGFVPVNLIEPCLQESNVHLKIWNMNSRIYVLTTRWNAVWERKENKGLLEENNIIQVWSFRVDDELWFAINKVVGLGVGGDNADALSSAGEASSP